MSAPFSHLSKIHIHMQSVSFGLLRQASTKSASNQISKHDSLHENNNKNMTKNIEEFQASQKAKFSPVRNRETSSARISSSVSAQQPGSVFTGKFMSDQGSQEFRSSNSSQSVDSHVGVYDCHNTVSLTSVVQGNVPVPYEMNGEKILSQYNMQGGLDCQGDKYLSGDLNEHHHTRSSSKLNKVE